MTTQESCAGYSKGLDVAMRPFVFFACLINRTLPCLETDFTFINVKNGGGTKKWCAMSTPGDKEWWTVPSEINEAFGKKTFRDRFYSYLVFCI